MTLANLNNSATRLGALVGSIFFLLILNCVAARAGTFEVTAKDKAALDHATQGAIVHLDDLYAVQTNLTRLPLQITDAPGPQFLFSDKPEYFLSGDGISLQEEVKPGVVRLYIYHVPQPTNGPKVISAVIENLGKRPLKFRFLHRAFPKPSNNYHLVGKTGLMEYFNSHREGTNHIIPPGGRMVIDPDMDQAVVHTDQLVHGFYEFSINQPARVSVFEREPEQSSVAAIDHLPKLSSRLAGERASGAGRGLFLTNNFEVRNESGFVLDTTNGVMRLSLSQDKKDRGIRGHDSIDGTNDVKDSGNYGVMYRIRIKRSSSDGRGLALLMTKPREGGKWCSGLAAAVQVSRGKWDAGAVAIPTDRVDFGQPGEMVLIQKFPPVHRGWTDTIEIMYSPPGASCMPTPMLLVPY